MVYSAVSHKMVYTGLVLSLSSQRSLAIAKCMSCDIELLCTCVQNYKIASNLQIECKLLCISLSRSVFSDEDSVFSWTFALRNAIFGAKLTVITQTNFVRVTAVSTQM